MLNGTYPAPPTVDRPAANDPSPEEVRARADRFKQQHLEEKRHDLSPWERRILAAARDLAPDGGPLGGERTIKHAHMGCVSGNEAIAKLKAKGLWIWDAPNVGRAAHRSKSATPTKAKPSPAARKPSLLEQLHQKRQETKAQPEPRPLVAPNVGTDLPAIEATTDIAPPVSIAVEDGQIVVSFHFPFADFVTWATGRIQGSH